MSHLDIADYLAMPGELCIRIRVGPRVDDVVDVSQLKFDADREVVREFCIGLDAEATSWRQLKAHTGGNGLFAKVLVALGHLAGAWVAHPSPEDVAPVWTSESPRVLSIPVQPRRVKPSAGDLDAPEQCGCCHRPMGASRSTLHDLVASEEVEGLCYECALDGCELGEDECKVFAEKKATIVVAREEVEETAPEGLEAYLKLFE